MIFQKSSLPLLRANALSRLEFDEAYNNDERVAPHPRLVLLVHS